MAPPMPNLQDDQKPHCPVMRYFGAAKNSIATSCGILERPNATLPSCAQFRNDQMQNWYPVQFFKTTSRNFAVFQNSLIRRRAILPLRCSWSPLCSRIGKYPRSNLHMTVPAPLLKRSLATAPGKRQSPSAPRRCRPSRYRRYPRRPLRPSSPGTC